MTLEEYLNSIDCHGLEETWHQIIENDFKGIEDAGELYEIGLAHVNKDDKKKNGKYFTPKDVANIMAEWLSKQNGSSVCDVCCGTGNLILSYLDKIGYDATRRLIGNGRLYLYDKDVLAIEISRALICHKYGIDLEPKINCLAGDFLDKNVKLPNDCKVISNPPYFKISEIDRNWNKTDVLKKSKEFYAAIMEKILNESESSVIITPYSFIGSDKFYELRKIMNSHNGFIVAFDNVPGNIFSGKKHGVFNSNTANSVRAAITVTENKESQSGYRCSSLIRFKNDERGKLLNISSLESFIGSQYQTVDTVQKKYCKCHPELEDIYNAWMNVGVELKDLQNPNGIFNIYIPNTCRYYTVAAAKDLKRTGKVQLSFDDEDIFKIVYCFINSSFCYWYWRLFDGGITYTSSLINSLPVINPVLLSVENKARLIEIAGEMQKIEPDCLVYKKNAGNMQENIKFPDKYRTEINNIFLKTLGIDKSSEIFDKVHSNTAFVTAEKGGEV